MKSGTLDYYYDKEKYREMILDVQNSSRVFGFDRIVYGNFKKKRRKRYEEFKEERAKYNIHIGLDD